MFKAIHFIGSLLIFVWFAIMFMGDDVSKLLPMPYSELLLKYKWLLLIAGIIFSLYGFSSVIKQRRKHHSNQSNRYTTTDNISKSGITKKNFVAEQLQNRAIKGIEETVGHGSSRKLKELALKVDWSPLSGGGANFKTKKLVKLNESRIEIIHSNGGKLFSLFFILMGSVIPGFIAFSMLAEKGMSWEMLFPFFIGFVFVGVGFLMLIYPRPRIFDKRQGWFWAGNKGLQREQAFLGLKKSARLSEIAAIQVIPERVSGSKGGSYISWEINLVSEDGQRLNVLDHGHKQSIIEDAQLLGEFLGIPVWENA